MKLKDWLKDSEISPNKMAKVLGFTAQTIYNVVSGSDIKLSTACRIVAFTNGSVDYADLISKKERQKFQRTLKKIEKMREDETKNKKKNKVTTETDIAKVSI